MGKPVSLLPGERRLGKGDRIELGDLVVTDDGKRVPVYEHMKGEDPTTYFDGCLVFVRKESA